MIERALLLILLVPVIWLLFTAIRPPRARRRWAGSQRDRGGYVSGRRP